VFFPNPLSEAKSISEINHEQIINELEEECFKSSYKKASNEICELYKDYNDQSNNLIINLLSELECKNNIIMSRSNSPNQNYINIIIKNNMDETDSTIKCENAFILTKKEDIPLVKEFVAEFLPIKTLIQLNYISSNLSFYTSPEIYRY
ncbi:MAG: hypothetical protein MHPSP_002828, partial [Paramarteilia canceri]